MGDGAVEPYPAEGSQTGEEVRTSLAERERHALQGARNAYWVSTPGADGNGAVLAMDPQTGNPVMLKGNRKLEIPLASLKGMAIGARAQFSNFVPVPGSVGAGGRTH